MSIFKDDDGMGLIHFIFAILFILLVVCTYLLFSRNKEIGKCEGMGGVYLRQEEVCVNLQKIELR